MFNFKDIMKKDDIYFSESEDDLWWPYGRYIFSLIFICLLLACNKSSHKRNSNELSFNKNQDSIARDGLIKLAKHYDIPSPVGYEFIYNAEKEESQDSLNSDFVRFVGNLPKDQVLSFYRGGMEQHGWKIIDLSNEQEGLLFCKKPNKYCTVSIRDEDKVDKHGVKRNHVCLFIKNKMKGEEKQKKDINSRDIALAKLFS